MFDVNFAEESENNLNEVNKSIKATRETLHANNEKLSGLRDDSFQKRRLIALKKKELNTVHDRIKNTLANEMDGRGKAKFSNEVKRQAEFIERVANDATCREFEEQLDTMMISSAQIDNQVDSIAFNQEILMLDYKLGLQLLEIFGKSIRGSDGEES